MVCWISVTEKCVTLLIYLYTLCPHLLVACPCIHILHKTNKKNKQQPTLHICLEWQGRPHQYCDCQPAWCHTVFDSHCAWETVSVYWPLLTVEQSRQCFPQYIFSPPQWWWDGLLDFRKTPGTRSNTTWPQNFLWGRRKAGRQVGKREGLM